MSPHGDALAVLEAWVPPSPAQERLQERYVAHLRTHPDGVLRTCRPDHLTASTLVVSPGVAHVLLTLHARARRWFQFGGHLEPGDPTLLAAARREATEESGLPDLAVDPVPLRLDEHEVPFCGPPAAGRVTRHLDVWFLAVAPAGAAPVRSPESLDVRWWPAEQLRGDPVWAEALDLARARLQSVSDSPAGSRWAPAE